MPSKKLSPEGEVIAAYGAATVAAFQVLINQTNHQSSQGKPKTASFPVAPPRSSTAARCGSTFRASAYRFVHRMLWNVGLD